MLGSQDGIQFLPIPAEWEYTNPFDAYLIPYPRNMLCEAGVEPQAVHHPPSAPWFMVGQHNPEHIAPETADEMAGLILHGPESTEEGMLHADGQEVDSLISPDRLFQDDVLPTQRPVASLPLDILHVPSSLSSYFLKEVITRYCTWDSNSNLMRILIESMWQSSGALYHTMQSMSAACLSEDLPHLAKVALQERNLACQHAMDAVQSGRGKENQMLATFLLGHTSCWIDPGDVVPEWFTKTWTMVSKLKSNAQLDPIVPFLEEALEYWTMLLTFITDTEKFRPDTEHGPDAEPMTCKVPVIMPHPFSGVSREVVHIFTSTGRLIHQVRERIPRFKSVRGTDLNFFYEALREAGRLERRIMAHIPLDISSMAALGDPKTLPIHFKIIDDAFRYTALLQLYRVFPDLLSQRYRPWDSSGILLPQAACKIPSEREMNVWLTQLAIFIVEMLRDIPEESRTRCIQPPILVAVSSDLRYECPKPSSFVAGDHVVRTMCDSSIEVARARRFVGYRLSAYAHMLPLHKVRKYYEVVRAVWAALDAGNSDVFWVDIVCNKQYSTVLG